MPPDAKTHDVVRRELDVRVGFGLFASEDQLGSLLSIARRVDVEAGQVLFQREQPVVSLFQVVAGEVELSSPQSPSWRVSDRGAVGLIDFALARPHARGAVATSPTQLLELDAAEYRDYLEDNYEVGYRIITQMSGRLISDVIADPAADKYLATGDSVEQRSFVDVEIPLVERLIMLSRMPAFRGSSMQALANLAQSATEHRFDPGDVITTAGIDPMAVSLLVEGAVELAISDRRIIRRKRDLVAHLEELAVGPRSISVTAATPSIVLKIERDDLIDRIEEHFDLAMTILGFVAREQEQLNDAGGRCRVA